MTPSIYINLEDDVSKIVERIKRESSAEVVLVCPKRCFLFNDSINLRLLKKQTDLLKKSVSILTMDERGQMYAKEAGFALRFLPKSPQSKSMSDIEISARQLASVPDRSRNQAASRPVTPDAETPAEPAAEEAAVPASLEEIKLTAKKLSKTSPEKKNPPANLQAPVIKTQNFDVLPSVSAQENIFPLEIEEHYKNHAESKGKGWKIALSLVATAAIATVLIVFLLLPKAEVTVVPKSDVLVRDLEISFSTAVKEADPTKLVLPAVQVNEQLEMKKSLESQGKKEVGNRAAGYVKIYNFTRAPISLKAETTTLSLNGKNYQLVGDITQLRPTAYKNARTKEVDEASLVEPVEIIAAEGGDGYNLPAGTRLEITNKVFGSKPQLLYAKTDSAISGGTSRYLSIVSEQDIASAQDQLKAEALVMLGEKLRGQNLNLPEDAYTVQVAGFEADKAPGTQSPSFGAKASVKISGLAISQQALEKLIFDRINQTLADNKTLSLEAGNYQLAYKTKELEPGGQVGVLSVHFQGRVWYNLDASLKEAAAQLKNTSPEQASSILSENSEIERIDIVLSPSWQKKLPFLTKNIEIKIQP